jgi:hypothetical protein
MLPRGVSGEDAGVGVATTVKAKGQQGSWEATVSGEVLPCVFDYWWVKGNKDRLYHDPGLDTSEARHIKYVNRIIESKKVVLVRGAPSSESFGRFERKDYIAVWSVEDVEFDRDGLKFRFVSRLAELK